MTKTSNNEPLVLAFAETFHHHNNDPIPDLDMDAMFPPLLSSRQQQRSTSLCHTNTNIGTSTFVQVASHCASRLHAPLKQSQFRSGLESQKYNTTTMTRTQANAIGQVNDNVDPLWEYHARKEENVLKTLRDNRRMKQHRQELSDRLLRRYVRLACKDYNNDEDDISDDSPTAIKLKQEERLNELLQSLPKHYFAPGKDMSRVEYVKHLMCNVQE
ncbi:hypothetical protein O0I10_010543 [Lichtheimia ornata]|uniref:Uncharacterized protein n=1 Tax=Lichtheimia ornata TaxID=688661 RepID=A0AAD7UVS6_9FUNG|nr:uncharacterized protein O0I10_010543 [Lichtheimia ornata]KAJ8653744.1 hypothetical protein O0I10_010543 [Lichtheimia ornata]